MDRAPPPPADLFDLQRAALDLVKTGAAPLPPYPAVALRVKQAAGRQDIGLAEISQLVRSDAALAADLLRCANSTMYRRGDPVTSLTQALTRVGAREVMRLALASSLASHAHAPGPLAPVRRLIWLEGIASAVLCQELARLRHLDPEEAFVVGLLHDFGKIVAASCVETVAGRGKHDLPWPVVEWAELLERLHVPLGVEMATRWHLPEIVIETISAHHGGGPDDGEADLLQLVRISDRVVGLLSSMPQVSATELGRIPALASEAEREALAHVIQRIPEFVASFEPAASREATGSPFVAAGEAPGAQGRAVSFPVSVRVARRSQEHTAVSISPNGLVLKGKEPIPENRLLEAILRCPPSPLSLWALIRSCRPEQDGFRIELQPYALSSETRSLWNQLLATGEIVRT